MRGLAERVLQDEACPVNGCLRKCTPKTQIRSLPATRTGHGLDCAMIRVLVVVLLPIFACSYYYDDDEGDDDEYYH